MGDYCDFINVTDKRFDFRSLAKWIRMEHLVDIARAQTDRFLEFTKPIAHKCLALVEGNHEEHIKLRYENSVYDTIVTEMKRNGGMRAKDPLGIGYYGWLILRFMRTDDKIRSKVKINLHHGFTGGKLAGGKALNMQRWLWTHDCDLALMGHSHNTEVQIESVETVDNAGKAYLKRRVGAFCGTFLASINQDGSSYSERGGYFPLPVGNIEVELRPGAENKDDIVTVNV